MPMDTLHLGPPPKINNVQGAIWLRLERGGGVDRRGQCGEVEGAGEGSNEHKHMEKQIFPVPAAVSEGKCRHALHPRLSVLHSAPPPGPPCSATECGQQWHCGAFPQGRDEHWGARARPHAYKYTNTSCSSSHRATQRNKELFPFYTEHCGCPRITKCILRHSRSNCRLFVVHVQQSCDTLRRLSNRLWTILSSVTTNCIHFKPTSAALCTSHGGIFCLTVIQHEKLNWSNQKQQQGSAKGNRHFAFSLMCFTVDLRGCQFVQPVGFIHVHSQRSRVEGQGQLSSCRAPSQEEGQATPNVLFTH